MSSRRRGRMVAILLVEELTSWRQRGRHVGIFEYPPDAVHGHGTADQDLFETFERDLLVEHPKEGFVQIARWG